MTTTSQWSPYNQANEQWNPYNQNYYAHAEPPNPPPPYSSHVQIGEEYSGERYSTPHIQPTNSAPDHVNSLEEWRARFTTSRSLKPVNSSSILLGSPSSGPEGVSVSVDEHLSCFCSLNELQDKFGIGIRLLFSFIRFSMGCNFVLLLLALGNWIPHMVTQTHREVQLRDLFLSSYPDDWTFTVWKATYAVVTPLTFIFPLVYFWSVTQFIKKQESERVLESQAVKIWRNDIIDENKDVSTIARILRIMCTYSVFVLMLTAVFFATKFFTEKQIANPIEGRSNVSPARQYAFAGLISLTIIIINQVWYNLCKVLTDFEKLPSVTAVRQHNAFKLIMFRVINLLVVMRTQADVVYDDQSVSQCMPGGPPPKCVTDVIARQFFVLSLIEFALAAFFAPAYPLLLRVASKLPLPSLHRFIDPKDPRPPFDVADEYVEVIYRLYMAYIGVSVFPLITLLCLLTNIVEYYVDKYTMLRLCRPPTLKGSMKKPVTVFLVIIAVAAVLSAPRLSNDEYLGFFWKPCKLCP